MRFGREARRMLRGIGMSACRNDWSARNLFRAVMRPSLVSVVRMPMSSSCRRSIFPKSVIDRPILGMRTSCPRSEDPLYVASSLPATINRTSSVFTYVGSWPCLRIAARSAFVDQYVGFFEITPIFMGRPRASAEPRDAVRGRKTCREDEAVKDISTNGYRPEEGSQRVHPVVSDRRRNVARTTIGV